MRKKLSITRQAIADCRGGTDRHQNVDHSGVTAAATKEKEGQGEDRGRGGGASGSVANARAVLGGGRSGEGGMRG